MKESPYTKDFGWYLSKATPAIRRMLDAEEEYLCSEISGGTVLECGCGDGRVLHTLSGIADRVIGVDLFPAQVMASKSNAPHGNVGVVPASMLDLPFKDGLFDHATIMFNTFGGFGDDEKHTILSEVRRVLKKDGKLHVSVYAENAYPYQQEFYRRFGYESYSLGGATHAYGRDGSFVSERFTKEKLAGLLHEAGFERVKVRKLNEFSYIAKAYN